MAEGASIIMSLPVLFLGKAMKSRMLLLPDITAHNLSKPKAMPPCGGAPYSKAPSRKPNCSSACSGVKPRSLKFLDWSSRSWIRMEPPPISTPLRTRS